MRKPRSVWRCQACGYQAFSWMGRCPECGEWESLVEEVESQEENLAKFNASPPIPLQEVKAQKVPRFPCGISEFDRVLGGGIVPKSAVLVGGEPGIGKSTLLLQVAAHVSQEKPVIYISGEESASQIGLRAERLGLKTSLLFVSSQTNLLAIFETLKEKDYFMAVVDSVQTLYHPDISSAPGSVSQVREASSSLIRLAKETGLALFLIGHVTKEGALAGPKVLEHLVDTVLYFEGEYTSFHRIIRSFKNRFGSTDEIGVFEMTATGLKEVKNPGRYFLPQGREERIGSAIVAVMEGSRPFLVEIQALVSRSYLPSPRRLVVGADFNRALIVNAVLEKELGLRLYENDIYIATTGGLKIKEPAADLGMAVALFSSYHNLPLTSSGVFFGEVDLTGKLRAVTQVNLRLKEAAKLGFKWAIGPIYDKIMQTNQTFNYRGCKTLMEVKEIIQSESQKGVRS